MPIIRPISDLRNTNEISELCHSTGEPIFITKNGYGDLVVMSEEVYEKTSSLFQAFEALKAAQRHIDSGLSVDGDKKLEELREKYGYE